MRPHRILRLSVRFSSLSRRQILRTYIKSYTRASCSRLRTHVLYNVTRNEPTHVRIYVYICIAGRRRGKKNLQLVAAHEICKKYLSKEHGRVAGCTDAAKHFDGDEKSWNEEDERESVCDDVDVSAWRRTYIYIHTCAQKPTRSQIHEFRSSNLWVPH